MILTFYCKKILSKNKFVMDNWNPQREAYRNRSFNPSLGKSGESQRDVEDGRTLYITGISPDLSERAFRNLFEKYGKVVHCKLLPPRNPYEPRVGFIGYGSVPEAHAATRDLNDIQLGGFLLKVAKARPRKSKSQAQFEKFAEKVEKGLLIDADAQMLKKQAEEKFFANSRHSQSPSGQRQSKSAFSERNHVSPQQELNRPPSRNDKSNDDFSSRSLNHINQSRSHSQTSRSSSCSGNSSDQQHKFSLNSSKSLSVQQVGEKDANLSQFSSNEPTEDALNSNQKKSPAKQQPCTICNKFTSIFCEACKSAYYCSKECQKKDWPSHKPNCKRLTTQVPDERGSDDLMFGVDDVMCNALAENLMKTLSVQPQEANNLESSKVTEVSVKTDPKKISAFANDVKQGTMLDLLVIDLDQKSSFLVCQSANAAAVEALDALQEDINSRYQSQPAAVLSDIKVGDCCAAVFHEDNKWYRAKVREICEDSNVLIQFVDYGNCEYVSSDAVVELEEQFCKWPAFSMMCKFDDSSELESWTEKQATYLVESLQANSMLIQAQCTNIVGEFLFAQFWSGKVWLNEKMKRLGPIKVVKQKSSVSPSSAGSRSSHNSNVPSSKVDHKGLTSPEQKIHLKPLTEEDFWFVKVPDEEFKVFVSCVESPGSFFVQVVAQDFKDLHDYQSQLTKHFTSTESTNFSPSAGHICAGLLPHDKQWYRVKVLNVLQPNSYKVLCLDFGYTLVVENTHLQPLPVDFCGLPVQAVKTRLANCFPRGGKWSREAIAWFKKSENTVFEAKAVKLTAKGDDVIELVMQINENKTFNDKLVSLGFASRSQTNDESLKTKSQPLPTVCTSLDSYKPPLNEKLEIVVTSLGKPGQFCCYVQQKFIDVLNQNSKALVEYCECSQPPNRSTIKEGMFCAAYYEKKGFWLRAQIVTVKEALIQVRSVDYGNTLWVLDQEIRELPLDFKQPPMLALSFVLADVKLLGEEWNHEFNNTVNNFIGAKFEAVFIALNGKTYVAKVPGIINQLIRQRIADYCL